MRWSSAGIVIIVIVITGIGAYWTLTGSERGYRGPTKSYTSERFDFSFKYPAKYQIKAKYRENIPSSFWPSENRLARITVGRITVHDNLTSYHDFIRIDVWKKKGLLKGRSLKEERDLLTEFAENNENVTFVEGPKIVRGGKGLIFTRRIKLPPRWRKEYENSKYLMDKQLTLVGENLGVEVKTGWGENRYMNLKEEISLVFESFTLER